MNASPFILDVTQNTFSQVLDGSYRQPVLVDFWADWCQPCQVLTPLLSRLAEEYQGAFLLAKVNADREQALAAQFRVRALPTVKVVRTAQVVEDIVGVQPESVYRAAIKRHQAKPSDSLKEQAQSAWERGQPETALNLLRQAASLEPDNTEVKIALAEKLLALNHIEEATETLQQLPPEVGLHEPASGLLARLEFINMAKDAPPAASLQATVNANPDDYTARYQLGACKVAEGDFEAALEQFLEILRRTPRSASEGGQKALLAVFTILGKNNPLVTAYRRKMAALLH